MRKARIRAGLTQKQLADKVGVVQNYIGMIERGVSIPSLPTIIAISEALDIKLDSLLKNRKPQVQNNECIEYRKQIAGKIETLNKQQLLCMLDTLDIIEKYM